MSDQQEKKQMCIRDRLADLLDQALHPALELAPELGTRHQGGEVQQIDLLIQQLIGHLPLGDLLGLSLIHILTIPDTHDLLLPSLGVVPLQLFAYYVALMRGCDIDKPRNLAKSVTVE